ncbi:uncharacterized protein RCC_03943 [Ramularia collo-cygni]|uniref:Ubiquitin-like domain-containing protein n=1 Tax=Ramularia collo-cygni TaxID=112498 RepID=A0A2D3VC76_9PEZI|nr:uncharacterized protein RCC_03943 [Ramularia collo-cygni]CZT18103.1 uncharacterized protein RCC_03943 [Ramularia collo-cygni]
MARQQHIKVEVFLPVECFNALKDSTSAHHDTEEEDRTAAMVLLLEEIDNGPFLYPIFVEFWGQTRQIWIAPGWTIAKIWELLEELYGIKRLGLKMAFQGQEIADDDQRDVRDFRAGATFYIVPESFWNLW